MTTKNPNVSTEHQKEGDAARPKDTLDRDTPANAPARPADKPEQDARVKR